MKFLILLIALFAFVSSNPYYDNYGCNTGSKNSCCWANYNSCCKPPEGKRTCNDVRTVCCKHRQYDMAEGEYVYTFTGGTDTD